MEGEKNATLFTKSIIYCSSSVSFQLGMVSQITKNMIILSTGFFCPYMKSNEMKAFHINLQFMNARNEYIFRKTVHTKCVCVRASDIWSLYIFYEMLSCLENYIPIGEILYNQMKEKCQFFFFICVTCSKQMKSMRVKSQ